MTGSSKDVTAEREEWSRQMRLMFSPKEMLYPDGKINQDYFRPVIVSRGQGAKARQFGPEEKERLNLGIEKYGVGSWKDIQREFLNDWSEVEIRLRTARALGSQSITSYLGWKGSTTEIEREWAKNREIGIRLGRWKGSVLVKDEQGIVEQVLAGKLTLDEAAEKAKSMEGTTTKFKAQRVEPASGEMAQGSSLLVAGITDGPVPKHIRAKLKSENLPPHDDSMDPSSSKRRGRKLGSKNRKTLERLSNHHEMDLDVDGDGDGDGPQIKSSADRQVDEEALKAVLENVLAASDAFLSRISKPSSSTANTLVSAKKSAKKPSGKKRKGPEDLGSDEDGQNEEEDAVESAKTKSNSVFGEVDDNHENDDGDADAQVKLSKKNKKQEPKQTAETPTKSNHKTEPIKDQGKSTPTPKKEKEKEKKKDKEKEKEKETTPKKNKEAATKTPKKSRKEPAPVEIAGPLWVQCDDCNKWRLLPPGNKAEDLPERWVCPMNPVKSDASCDVPEIPY